MIPLDFAWADSVNGKGVIYRMMMSLIMMFLMISRIFSLEKKVFGVTPLVMI